MKASEILPLVAALVLGGCALPSATELGERYWRTKAESDRIAWIEALDREGHDFSRRYTADYGERGVYKFNREVRLACFVITKSIAERLGEDAFDEMTPDGPVHFEWKRKDDNTVDYRYSAPTNWEVFVRAYGNRSRRNPIEEANVHLSTSISSEGCLSLTIMHHREEWKAGPYADYPFPTNEIRAANNFAFGLREVFRRLGFARDGAVRDGRIWLATFDSNFPDGHTDFPPHFHIGLSCRDGSQVHHFYIRREDGRITSDCYQDMSNVIDVWDRAVEFLPGGEFPAFDGHGRVAFRVRMLEGGTGLEILLPDGSARMRVSSDCPKDGVEVFEFTDGIWKPVTAISIVDDSHTGVMRVPEGEIRYDPDTGKRKE